MTDMVVSYGEWSLSRVRFEVVREKWSEREEG